MLKRDKTTIAWILFFYSLFIFYGSLVPLHFNQLSVEQAVKLFSQLEKFDFHIINKSDWFTNFLLFMPVTYLLLFILKRPKNKLYRGLQLTMIVVILIGVSIGIEFNQLFISQRVSSFKDVFAQFLGILLSYVIYLFSRMSFIRLAHKLNHNRVQQKWLAYANVMIIVFIIYNLMPLDLSVSPVEIFKKWQAGRLNIIPFSSLSMRLDNYLFSIVSDIFIWATITWFYLKSKLYSPTQIIKKCMFFAFAIEAAQLFVLSRHTDITDIFSVIIGVSMCLKLNTTLTNNDASQLKAHHNSVQQSASSSVIYEIKKRLLNAESLFIGWCILLFFLTVFPLDIIQNKQLLVGKWQLFLSVPLETYWREGPLQALTQLLRKILLLIPLGILIMALCFKHKLKPANIVVFQILIVSYVFGLEILQLLLANKTAVLSDSLLNLLGLLIGREVYMRHTKQTSQLQDHFKSSPIIKGLSRNFYPILVFLAGGLTLFFIFTHQSTPYNVKELFVQYPPLISAFMISLYFFVAFGFPTLLIDLLKKHQKISATRFLAMSLLHSFLLFNLFFLTFSNESIYDILGFPIWHSWPQHLELAYRFLGFQLPISSSLMLINCWLTHSKSIDFKVARLGFSLLFIAIVLPLGFLVVVVQAGTDNIVELLPNNGYSFKLINIIAYLLLLIFVATWWIRRIKTSSIGFTILLTLVSAPIGYFLITNGLQNFIFKYDQIFSALQFLLSPSRTELLDTQQVFFRFVLMHYMMVLTFYVYGSSLKHIGTKRTSLNPPNGR